MIGLGVSGALIITALATVGLQLFFFAIAYTFRFDKVTDLAGTANFILIALLTFLDKKTYFVRQIIVTGLVLVWGFRLGSMLVYRVFQRGHDARFDEMRDNCGRFFVFWIFQMLWAWIVSLPVTFLNSTGVDVSFGTRTDIAGIILWGIGFIVQAIADHSKLAFSQDPNNKSKFLDAHVWAVSRHPNYFGEIVMWVGIFLISTSVFEANSMVYAYLSVLSPVFTYTILMFLSGVPPAEDRYDKKFGRDPVYLSYKESTSVLVPFPPALYRPLPKVLKQIFFCEYPMYSRRLSSSSEPLRPDSVSS